MIVTLPVSGTLLENSRACRGNAGGAGVAVLLPSTKNSSTFWAHLDDPGARAEKRTILPFRYEQGRAEHDVGCRDPDHIPARAHHEAPSSR